MNKIREKIGLNASTLKWIAIILMFLNHLCFALFDKGLNNYFLTDAHWYLTRIAFIIFAFQLAEGFFHTRNKLKYIVFLFIFAILTEIPFDLCFYGKVFEPSNQNVLWTLGIGALAYYAIDRCNKSGFYTILIAIIAMVVCTAFSTDYGCLGIATIISFYYFRECRWKQLLITFFVFAIFVFIYYITAFYRTGYSMSEIFDLELFWHKIVVEMHALAAWPLLMLYNGKKGRNINKWFFYCFYPVHLLFIYVLMLIIF